MSSIKKDLINSHLSVTKAVYCSHAYLETMIELLNNGLVWNCTYLINSFDDVNCKKDGIENRKVN